MPDLAVLLALVLGLLHLEPAPVDVPVALLGTLASVAVGVAMSWMAGDRGERAVRGARLDVAVRAAWMTRLWPLVGWFAALVFFGWGAFVATTFPRETWLGRYVVLFLPAGALWMASWAAEARIERAVAEAQGALVRRAQGLAAAWGGVKRNALALLPLFVLLGLLDGIWVLGELGVPGVRTLSRWIEVLPLLSVAVMLALFALLSHFLPALLRLVLPTESLPAGRLRSLLEEQAAAIGLRYRDIVVWKTRGNVTNAMVVGYTPGTRTIFLTDGLLRHLPDDEVLAVFCHEAGHAKKWHLPLLIALFGITALLFEVFGGWLMAHGVPVGLVVLAHLLVLWFVILGVVSRFLEREADVYGAEHAADLSPEEEGLFVPTLGRALPAGTTRMIRALQRVRQVTGRGSSHRHGTIESRVDYLAAHAADPGVRTRFQRTRRRLLQTTAALGVIAILGAAARLPVDLAYARATLAHEEAVEAYTEAFDLAGDAAKAAAARPLWREAYEGFEQTAAELGDMREPRAEQLRLWALYNRADTAFHGLGEGARAREHYETARKAIAASGEIPPEDRRRLLFQIDVDLGRILAQAGETEAAAEALERARATRPRADGREGAYWRARLGLLEAALDAARGDVAAARDRLGRHVLPAAVGEGDEWEELRRDARAALERLEAGTAEGEADGEDDA